MEVLAHYLTGCSVPNLEVTILRHSHELVLFGHQHPFDIASVADQSLAVLEGAQVPDSDLVIVELPSG